MPLLSSDVTLSYNKLLFFYFMFVYMYVFSVQQLVPPLIDNISYSGFDVT